MLFFKVIVLVCFWRIKIFVKGLSCLFTAWVIKIFNRMQDVKFPNVSHRKKISDREKKAIIACTDFFVKYCTLRTGRKCFFRSYIMGKLLCKQGIPVVMNVGLPSRANTRKNRGHCWLTLDGQPFAETVDITKMFSVDMGSGYNGIRYWTDDIKTG
jgi:hypothetical protein